MAFESTHQRLLQKYCISCHSAAEHQGELDLEPFSSVSLIRKDVVVWQRVLDMLNDREMPPKDAKLQPSPAEINSLKTWVQSLLDADAISNAGDPGPVVLRRLNNAEFTYTIQDLTGVELFPAAEFPSDSAAGEGFTNVGSALVMSPALLEKYLEAAKQISNHAMLVPSGIQFSKNTTKQDCTNEKIAAIQSFYSRFSESGGASAVNLQGIQFETNGGGRLPLASYLKATLMERDALMQGETTLAIVASKHSLNEKYLTKLWNGLQDDSPSILLDIIRSKWRAANVDGLADLIGTITRWQKSLWRFATIGHIGKRDGPTAWQVPVEPFADRHELRVKVLPPKADNVIRMYLIASDLSDGNANDYVVWENPRFVSLGKPDLRLRDLRSIAEFLYEKREAILSNASACLEAAAFFLESDDSITIESLARDKGIDELILKSWFAYLGILREERPIDAYLNGKMERSGQYDFIQGWVGDNALSVIANSSDQLVRVPGDMNPRSIGVHPAPTKNVAVGWRSPIAGQIEISGSVKRAHMSCGNGVTWSLEHRHKNSWRVLASGIASDAKEQEFTIPGGVAIHPGDLVSLIIGPRNGEHTCDLTAIELTISDRVDPSKIWDLSQDVSPQILSGNPHADRLGNKEVWNFYCEQANESRTSQVPRGCLLDKWWGTSDRDERLKLANDISVLLRDGCENHPTESPDSVLFQQITSLSGPLFSNVRKEWMADSSRSHSSETLKFGLAPTWFGLHPNGSPIDESSICVQAPSELEVIVPADLVEGYEFVAAGSLHRTTGHEGTVQLRVSFEKPVQTPSLFTGEFLQDATKTTWSDGDKPVTLGLPILAFETSTAKARLASQVDAFRQLFPAALCYTKVVPVDEVVTLTLFYREDDHLKRLMLNESQCDELDQLWDELNYVSEAPIALVDAYEQLWQFATQDADPSAFTPMRDGIMLQAAQFKARGEESESIQLQTVLDFAEKAWRRPLQDREQRQLKSLYHRLRSEELGHRSAIRAILSRVLVSPAFLYRSEKMPVDREIAPIDGYELASRLSYFLWSSMPDQELQKSAADGSIQSEDELLRQVRRMKLDPRIRRMAIEFGCQWLQVREFDQLDEKSETLFPEFLDLRADMREESIRFIEDMFRNDRSILDLINADHTFVNSRLAKFYGMPDVTGDWQRFEGSRRFSRGGILCMAATMAKQSGASRTSSILRGNWVSEFLLGEKLPRPPKNVPVLAEEAPVDQTERQMVERHSSDVACAKCHQRIDGFGFALEQFDTIGRFRSEDMQGNKIDFSSVLKDGTQVDGIDGLRGYITSTRRDDFLRTFCRRLLGYAIGRSVQLSDKPLIDQMMTELSANGFRISVAVERIVLSPQFRMIRSRTNP